MPNLIDKLITKVDTVRQNAADRFGLPAHNVYRVVRTYGSGIIGDGTYTDQEDLITPTPMCKFTGGDDFEHGGRADKRNLTISEVSLTYQENWLQGDPKSPGQEVFYKLVERNSQGADTTYWILTQVPEVFRGKVSWKLHLHRYTRC
ncbi:MAG TPA: hypothetical protein VIY48_10075 [Candidatus Paceibacterota bacterium]